MDMENFVGKKEENIMDFLKMIKKKDLEFAIGLKINFLLDFLKKVNNAVLVNV